MARKRVKQYLTLLMAVGVIAVVLGGSGSFASFNAQATNPGNTFATGSLILNDNGGTHTCTSAVDNTNENTSGTNCDTLFTVGKFAFATAKIGAATTITSASGATASLPITGGNGTFYKGDVLTLDNGSTTDTVTVVAPSYLASATGTLTVDATGIAGADSYTTNDLITDNNPTTLAKLTLSNVGTLDASGISFKSSAACTDSYGGGNTTLNMGTVTLNGTSGTTLTVADSTGFVAGDPLIVSEGGDTNTFKVQSVTNGTTIVVTAAQNWNHAYDTSATVKGVRFNGGTAPALCASLKLSITETDSTQNVDFSTASQCDYGTTSNPVATNACDLSGGTALSSLPTTLTDLTLKSSGGDNNTGTLLSAGGIRYFLLAVHYTGSTFGNTYQNWKSSSFDLTWNVNQS